jgi:ArsR family transcriptional regulator
VIAVDASAAMLRSAKARIGEFENVAVRRGDLEALPIEPATLDLAFLVLVLPYVAEPAAVIAEAARALKPGGRLLVTDLMPHERAEYQQTMGHQRQGVSAAQLRDWFVEAGLDEGSYRPLPLAPGAKGPMLFTTVGQKAR